MSQTDPGADTPTLTDFERYSHGVQEIQKSCACIRIGARDCYTARHYRPSDDLDEPTWEDDDDCVCSCHDEIRQLEEDMYGPEDWD